MAHPNAAWWIAPVLLPATLLLSSCGTAEGEGSGGDGPVVVASTNVYGDIAASVMGDLGTVTSIITSDAQDPHEYEATAQDRLALDTADIIIENGGGYDGFVDALLDGSDTDAVRLTAVVISGLASEEHSDEEHSDEEHSDEEHSDDDEHGHVEALNEHVWYDLHTAEKLAEALADELADIDPDNAEAYAANAEAFAQEVETLESEVESLRTAAEGLPVVMTEPLPVYLLTEAGLEDLTPPEFSDTVEEGGDVAPRVLQETLDLFAEEEIALLAYNTQTEDATIEQVRESAEASGVPVVAFGETLPEGQTYLTWMADNIDNLSGALS